MENKKWKGIWIAIAAVVCIAIVARISILCVEIHQRSETRQAYASNNEEYTDAVDIADNSQSADSTKQASDSQSADSAKQASDSQSADSAKQASDSQSTDQAAQSVDSQPELVESATSKTAAATQTAADTETTKDTLSLMMVGDDLLHKPLSEAGRTSKGTYNYDFMFRHIKKDIKQADVAMINQEVILGGAQLGVSGYPQFNARYEVGDAITKAGFNVVLHATNHALDRGAKGVRNCVKYWRTKHPKMKVIGMYDSAKSQNKIAYIKKNGIRIAVLNYTYGTNGIAMPKNMPYAVNLMTKSRVSNDVKRAKKKADFIVVCPHWGTEYKTTEDAYQKQWSKYFLKLGVNLVIGTHPHVIEPVKWMKDKKGHKMLVYYSLGNFINSSSRNGAGVAKQFYGGMAKVTLKRNAKGKVVISTAKFVPLVTHKSASGKVTTYKVSDYTKKLAAQNTVKKKDRGFSYAAMKRFFNQTIAKRFLAAE